MYIFLQNLSTMNISDPIFLSHIVYKIFVIIPPPPKFSQEKKCDIEKKCGWQMLTGLLSLKSNNLYPQVEGSRG